jgi:hypothetical protein
MLHIKKAMVDPGVRVIWTLAVHLVAVFLQKDKQPKKNAPPSVRVILLKWAIERTASIPLTALLCGRALAVQAALADVLSRYADAQTPDGRAAIVRNSHHLGREIQTAARPVMVQFQRSAHSLANWSAAGPRSFRLTFARPKRCNRRSSGAISHIAQQALLAAMRLGLSTGEMVLALTALLRPNATGFSPKQSLA